MLKNREKALEFFEDRNNVELPYSIVTRSNNLGSNIVIMGGIHGNESVGVNAIITYLKHIESKKINLNCGSITWILGNPEAYLQNRRLIDSNLNRAFTRQFSDNYEGRRASEIDKYLARISENSRLDCLLDLHSVSVGDFKVAICADVKNHYLHLKELTPLATHFTFTYKDMAGSTTQLGNELGAFSFAVECGNHHDEETIHTALWHINKVLLEYGVLDKRDLLPVEELHCSGPVKHFKCIEPIKPGKYFVWLNPDVSTGTEYKKGQVYAIVDGQERFAPKDCVAFIPDRNPSPNDSDAGFLCTLEIKSSDIIDLPSDSNHQDEELQEQEKDKAKVLQKQEILV